MRLLMAAFLAIQAAPPPSEADKIEAALRKMTDREYRMLAGDQELCTMTMKQRIETEGGRKIAVFEFVARMTRDGKTEEGSMIGKAELDGLRFLSLKTIEPGGKVDRTLEVKDGKVELRTFDDKTRLIDVTPETVSEWTLLRLPGVLEQKVGSSRKVDVLDSSSLNKGYELKCTERTTLEPAGAKHDAFKWQLAGESRLDLPSGPMAFKVVYYFWVSPEGVLLRYTMDMGDRKNEVVLELKVN